MQQTIAYAELSADVAALREVVSALDPKIRAEFEAESAAQRNRSRAAIQGTLTEIELLRQSLSRI